MKFEIQENEPEFKPIKVTIELETEQEMLLLANLCRLNYYNLKRAFSFINYDIDPRLKDDDEIPFMDLFRKLYYRVDV